MCVATGRTVRGFNTGRNKRAFSCLNRPALRDPTSLLFVGNRRVSTRGKAAGKCVDHSTVSILLPRLRISGTVLLDPSIPSWESQVKLYFEQNYLIHFQIVLSVNPYPTAFPFGNGMVLHFYQQQESSTTKIVHKVINKGLKTYV